MPSHQSGDLDISSDVTITGHVGGPILVHPGGVLVLMGTCDGQVIVRGGGYARISGTTHGLFVAAGGHAVLTGTCVGAVTNDGGDLSVSGVVTGDLVEYAGTTQVTPGIAVRDDTDAVGRMDLSLPSRILTSAQRIEPEANAAVPH